MLKHFSLILLFALCFSLPNQAQDDLLARRYEHLTKGVNLPFWFWYPPENPAERFDPAEFTVLRATGIDFVRLPIDLGFIYDAETEQFNEQNLALVDRAIRQLQEADLAVIVDLHSTSQDDSDASNFSGSLEDPEFVERYVTFWSAFAAHLSQFDPEMTIFGLMNEPVFYDEPETWWPIQERLVEAVREVAPDYTLIATGARWSSMDTLMELPLLDDPNILYEFHFYEPFPFTHQGATWAGTPWQELRDIPYPSSPEAVAGLDEGLSEEAADQIRWYGEERWNRQLLAERLGEIALWGKENGVYLICDEFGVYSEFAPADDRAEWIMDVREILESHGIAWAMWEYDSSFGLASRSANGTVSFDPAIIEALGLEMP